MLDIHRLRVFLIAAETLNFSSAAKRLHMTQPSVSQHIQALEQQFGTDLFVRSGRRLCLTEAGAVLVPLADKMVSMAMHAQEVMINLKGEVHGHLHVGCSTTPGKYILPKLLSKFIHMYPQVQATCQVHSRQEALKQLSQGKVHLALASTHEFDKECEFFKLFEDKIVMIAPLDHPWAKNGTVQLEDLLDARVIFRETDSGTYGVVKQGLELAGMRIEDIQPALTLSNAEAIAMAVQEGLGIGFVSEVVVSRLVSDKVAIIHVDGLSEYLHQDVYIGRNMLQPSTIAQTAFWDLVTSPINRIGEKITQEVLFGDLQIAKV
ncbi:MAG: LysR family transcriptional regulator [Anaerolineales bacterium]|nr:LysR family transcriptional regulator [Anaerolineales bacterium]